MTVLKMGVPVQGDPRSSSQLSRSVGGRACCGVELGVEEFAVVKGVGDGAAWAVDEPQVAEQLAAVPVPDTVIR